MARPRALGSRNSLLNRVALLPERSFATATMARASWPLRRLEPHQAQRLPSRASIQRAHEGGNCHSSMSPGHRTFRCSGVPVKPQVPHAIPPRQRLTNISRARLPPRHNRFSTLDIATMSWPSREFDEQSLARRQRRDLRPDLTRGAIHQIRTSCGSVSSS